MSAAASSSSSPRQLAFEPIDATKGFGASDNSPTNSSASNNFGMTLEDYAKSKPSILAGMKQRPKKKTKTNTSWKKRRAEAPNTSINSSFSKPPRHSATPKRVSDLGQWKRDKFLSVSKPASQIRKAPVLFQSPQAKRPVRLQNELNYMPQQRIIINNLAASVDDKLLRRILSSCQGFVKSSIHLSMSGKHLGFGDATFSNKFDAIKAIKFLRDKQINGSPINATLVNAQKDLMSSSFSSITQPRFSPAKPNRSMNSIPKQRYTNVSFSKSPSSINKSFRSPNSAKKTKLNAKNTQKTKRRTLTEEDLDKELELYNSQQN